MDQGSCFLRVTEVATAMGVSRSRVYALVREGLVPAVRDGNRRRSIRFPREAFELWLRRRVEEALASVPSSEDQERRETEN